MRTINLPSGEAVPALGQGTWRMGEQSARKSDEIRALQAGIDLGMTLIDTAEMYGEGGAEKIVSEAIRGKRDDLFIVSKVYPHNASREGVMQACERSLDRLKTDRIDLYLLHWPGNYDIAETLSGFEDLVTKGMIRYFGVSNFDLAGLRHWCDLEGGDRLATNQVLYNLGRRWPEGDLLPWCRQRGLPLMAYTPLEPANGRLESMLEPVAHRHGATTAQIALAWVLAQADVMAIPKASKVDHVQDNLAALEIKLGEEDHAELDAAFPPPVGPEPIEMI